MKRVKPNAPVIKPGLLASLLNVNLETLRSWRMQLDPNPRRKVFSSGDVFAYRILKGVLWYRFVPLRELKQCPISRVFSVCNENSIDDLAGMSVWIYVESYQIEFRRSDDFTHKKNFEIAELDLELLVNEHRQSAAAMLGVTFPREAT